MTNCCVVDLRFIGLPTAVVLPNPGRRVICADVNAHVVSSVKEGCTHNVEPDLDLALAESIAFGSLPVQATPAPADLLLVGHSSFKHIEPTGHEVLDLCGVTKRS